LPQKIIHSSDLLLCIGKVELCCGGDRFHPLAGQNIQLVGISLQSDFHTGKDLPAGIY
jgi:hypothetical protein